MYQQGYVAANDGNLSVRLDKQRVMVTPSGVSKGYMQPEEMVLMGVDGRLLDRHKKPTSESSMHLLIYKNRSDIMAVCHAHPPYATAFAVAGLALDQCILPEMVVSLGGVPLVEYGTPGTKDFSEPVAEAIRYNEALLLKNHGAVTVGPDIATAYHRMETLEHAAKIIYLAMQLGRPDVLTQEQVDLLKAQRSRFALKTRGQCHTAETLQSEDNKRPTNLSEERIREIASSVVEGLKQQKNRNKSE